jgi:superkiller protein 3
MLNAALKNDRQDDNLAALNLRGLIATDQRSYDEALDEFRHVLELYPNPGTLQHLANVLLLIGSNQEAFEAAEASIKLAPRSARAYNLAGVALMRLKRYDEALDFLHISSEINPKFAVAYYNQGIVFLNRKPPDNGKAIAMFTKATDANPDYALAISHVGLAR